MQSENRLKRKSLYDDQVMVDNQDASDNGVLYNTIGIGLAAAAGYGLYKSGALKSIMKPMLELADRVAREGTDKAAVTMSTIKQWSNLKHISPAQRSMSKVQSHIPPSTSIFRDRDSSLFYDIFEDVTSLSNSRRTNFHNMRNLMDGTVQDINLLYQMIKENQGKLPMHRQNYLQSELYYRMTELNGLKDGLAHNGNRVESILFGDKATDEFLKLMTVTKKEAAQELQESGYRRLVLSDILEVAETSEGWHELVTKPGTDIELGEMLNRMNRFVKQHTHGGNKTILSSSVWKDIMLDPNIRIDEMGNIIDYRMSKQNMIDFAHSLSNDFKLPLVQFNPFKTLLGFDKIGRRKPLMGVLSSKQFDPNITRIGGQGDDARIGNWLANTFGESYRNKNVSIINGTAYMVNEDNQLQVLGTGLKLHDITNADKSYGLKPMLNATRQMAGINTGEVWLSEDTVNSFTSAQKFRYKMSEMFDVGHREYRPTKDSEPGFYFTSSIDEMFDKVTDKLGGAGRKLFMVDQEMDMAKVKTFKSMFGEGQDSYVDSYGRQVTPRMFVTTKEGFKLDNAFNEFKAGNTQGAMEELQRFGKQFFVGRNADNTMHQDFTEYSGWLWSILNQLDEGLGGTTSFLGLSSKSKKSTTDLFMNLLLKRALPVYLATQVPGVINYLSEPFFGEEDETGNRDNITKFLMRKVVRPIDIGAHHAMDLTGATKFFKFMGEMVPGADQLGVHDYGFGLTQTAEEREEWIENGYEPVRKGRYWGSGNTPWTGGKIMYFRPNLYRRVEADVEFSDSKWGSRQEYYNNTWYPNPVNPLAPLNYFIFDRNHYDKKHYYDRPYLQTAPVGQNIPIVGPLFSSTVGRVISPPQKMHLEYWQNGLQVNPADEEPSSLITNGTLDNAEHDLNTFANMQNQTSYSSAVYKNTLYTSAYQAKQVTARTIQDNAGITFEERSILPARTYDRYDTPYEVYSTPSGGMSIVDVPDDMNLYNVNKDLQRYSINKVIGTNQRVTTVDRFSGPGVPVGNDSQSIDNAFVYGMGEQYNWLSDVAGLKGFAFQAFVAGEANEKSRMIEDSGYAYSINNDFWEENLGGLGGGISEITRRFVPKRNNNTEYINPIRNTMPSWMPGSDYFTDFKHGDPYSKIDNGEERLPGEGYERLHNIKGLMEFNIGSSSIGYEKDYIIQHMLKADKYKSTFEQDTLETGNRIHKEIQKAWTDAGLAISTEGKVEDKRNGIIGWYDAMVHDQSSPTGVAIVDIKSTSAKKLQEIRKSGKPLTHHMRQTNYYLWATGNTQSKGYIHYVDKENPNNTYTVGFNYSEQELKTTLQNVHDARNTIRKAVETGKIGRGELYSTVDKFRILADVAPYSQEYRDVSAQLASEDLSTEEQKEVSQIRQRVKMQKEPLRVYDYKFKTSNLKSEMVTVTKIIDNNTIVTKEYGKQHAIKFAGINVSMSNSEMYDDKRTKNDAARAAIRKHIRPGSRIRIAYDADERNKYAKDSTRSIRAVVYANGTNVNKALLNKGHATEKEDDNSPAAINARYSKGEIAFGSAMETITHKIVGKIPFIGSKVMQVRSPYEQYRDREVYGKDFQSWNHPVRDLLVPYVQKSAASGFGGVLVGGFVGSMFGKTKYGKLIGATVGAAVPLVGKVVMATGSTKDRDWRPKRRREQEKLNEYVDTLKYVKNMRLYEQYKLKAKKEDNFDVERFMKSKEAAGVTNKLRQEELTDYKRKIKLDFKHRGSYNFKYGKPKYAEQSMDKKATIRAINKELSELQSQRKVTKVPKNALKAIEFKQAAEKTMYGYDPGDSLVDIMSALPKKERQYFKHFMDAPEEEKEKILRIAPSYLRRALQASWGMPVDKKPSLQEYFQHHGLPDASWVGWDESTNIDDVKVKLIHKNKLDPGEFDVWDDDRAQADAVNIPIPKIDARNSARETQLRLMQILGNAGYNDIQTSFVRSQNGNNTSLIVKRDARDQVSQQISSLEI